MFLRGLAWRVVKRPGFRHIRGRSNFANRWLTLCSCFVLIGTGYAMSSSVLTHSQNPRVVHELRRLLSRMEGFSAEGFSAEGFSAGGYSGSVLPFRLPALDSHLPQGGLASGVPHELVPALAADLPAAFGFIIALLGCLAPSSPPRIQVGPEPGQTQSGEVRRGPLLLVMSARALAPYGRPHGRLYGHGLNRFGLDPARLILVETP